jgi:hypothetical protein
MNTITQRNFNGGAAEDIYNAKENEIGWSLNLDNTNKSRLFNYNAPESLVKSGCVLTTIGSDGMLYTIAQQTTPTVNIVIHKYDFSTATWTVLGTSFSGRYLTGRMFIEYHGFLYYFQGTSSKYVDKIEIATGAVSNDWKQLNNSGAIPTSFTGNCHTGLLNIVNDRLYFSYGNHIGRYSNRTGEDVFASPIFSISESYEIECLSRRNSQLALGANPKFGGNNSQVVFWDTFSKFADYSKQIPYGVINNLELVEGNLLCITSYDVNSNTGAQRSTNNGIYAYAYNGGEFELIKKHIGIRRNGGVNTLSFASTVHGSMLYFVKPILMRGYNDSDNVIWKFGKNGDSWQLTPDREFLSITNATDLTFYNDRIISTYYTDIEITKDSSNVTYASGKLLTQRYDCGAKYRKKKLKALQLNFIPTSPFENQTSITYPVVSINIYTDNNIPFNLTIDSATRLSFGQEFTTELEKCGVLSMEWETIQFEIFISNETQLAELSFVYDIKPQKIYDR